VHHQIAIPPDRLAAILKTLLSVDELARGQHPIRAVTRGIGCRIRVGESELVTGEAA
jgi:hypothetical protein